MGFGHAGRFEVDRGRIDDADVADRAGARDVELLRLVEQVGIGLVGHLDVAATPEQALLRIGQLLDLGLDGGLGALELRDLSRARPCTGDAAA